jgi:hypothetical protein
VSARDIDTPRPSEWRGWPWHFGPMRCPITTEPCVSPNRGTQGSDRPGSAAATSRWHGPVGAPLPCASPSASRTQSGQYVTVNPLPEGSVDRPRGHAW